jgi:hypothetical protein
LRQRFSFVLGKPDAAEENCIAVIAKLARRLRQRGQPARERGAADRSFDAFDVRANGIENADGSVRDLRPDAVAGKNGD